jgi:YD repeat-containing protein
MRHGSCQEGAMKSRFLSTIALCLMAGAPAARAAATALTCGQAQSGTVSQDGAQFSFGAQAGDVMLIRLVATSDNLNISTIRLQDSIGVTQTARSLGGTLDRAGYLLYTLNFTSTYTMTIAGTGAGTFQIAYVPVNRPCSTNTLLTCGQPSKGTLAAGGMVTYHFTGKGGDQVLLRLLTQQQGSDAGAALRFIALDPTYALQAGSNGAGLFGDTPGQGVASSQYRLTTDGDQTFVLMEASGLKKLSYAFSYQDFAQSCGASTASCGTAVDGTIGDVLTTNIYTISARKGDQYLVRLMTTDASGGLQAVLALYDPQGNLLQPTTSSDPTRATYTFPTDANFTAVVGDGFGVNTGKYAFALTRLNSPCNAQPLPCSTPATGQITGPLRYFTYSLTAQAGDVYLLRLLRTSQAGGFSPSVEIYGPDGSKLQSVITTDLSSVSYTTGADGAYTLLASDASSGTQGGSFAVWVSRLNRPCDGAVGLACGFMAQGAINQPLQSGLYTYNTAAGDAFSMRLVDTGGSLQSVLQVYDPRGQVVNPAAGTTRTVDVTNSPGGRYTILVTDSSRTPQQGTFAVQAFGTRGNCGSAVPVGQSVSGLVSGAAPFTSYVFRANQGEPLLVRAAAFTQGFSANVDLYDPTGRRMGSTTFRLAAQAPATGIYTALVGGSSPRSAGNYMVSVQTLDAPVATPLGCGQTISSVLGTDGQFRYYTVNASGGDLLKLVLSRLPSTTNAQVELFDPAGSLLATNASEIARKVAGAGDYLVLVSPSTAAAETGAFALALQKPNNPCSAQALTCGQSLLQPVTAQGQLDAYTFTGSTGDQVSIQVSPRLGSLSPLVELYDSSGNLVTGSGTGTSLSNTLTSANQYTVTVHDRTGANTGTYRIGLQRSNNACPENDTQKPTVTLRRPTGGEVIAGGSVYQIMWLSDDNVAVNTQTIQLLVDGKVTQTVANSLNGVVQSFNWVVPGDISPSRNAVIRVTATDRAGNSQSADSDMLTIIGSGFTPNTTINLIYDPLNRVISAKYQDGRVVQYTYDSVGNLIAVVVQ